MYDEDDFDIGNDDYFDDEPDLDFGFECDSAFASAGLGTDEDYGYFGGDDLYGEE